MKVILLSDIPAQKMKKDDVREVSDGYARNFLFPKKLAVPATAAALAGVNLRALREQRVRERSRTLLQKTADKLGTLTVVCTAKAHEGKLFGSIGAPQILSELKKHGVVLEAKQLKLDHPLKTAGEHRVLVKLGEGVETEVTVRVNEEI